MDLVQADLLDAETAAAGPAPRRKATLKMLPCTVQPASIDLLHDALFASSVPCSGKRIKGEHWHSAKYGRSLWVQLVIVLVQYAALIGYADSGQGGEHGTCAAGS